MNIWIYLGPLLSARYFDLKVVICWSHSFIRRHMKQKYLKRVEDIRVAHRDIANYFLEAFIESKPLVDMKRNVQIRYYMILLLLNANIRDSDDKERKRRLLRWIKCPHASEEKRLMLKIFLLCLCFERYNINKRIYLSDNSSL